ncbi:MAG: alkaline phosphatase family protein [Anaerolineae bacterium]|nr:alkaline phosphatase family protein [Anaerolineae bacterium]
MPHRVCVIGLDGTPHSLLQRMVAEGVMPNVASLLRAGSLRRMTSVYPWVSSVAWSTFMTGCNPARHGIFGFVDRDPVTFKTFIPTARQMRAEPLWDILSRAGKRVIVVNVPGTYPPRVVNGILISDFLSPTLEKAVYPPTLLPLLKELGYRIDTDPWLARESRQKFLPDLHDALAKRTRTFLHLLDTQPWDFFMGVVMETDRLHHFLFEPMEQGDPVYAPAFFDVYRRIDGFIGEVRRRLDSSTTLILLSDHGFCSIRREVYYNRWLYDAGYLRFKQTPPKDLSDLSPESLAYSLDPGRIFINLKGRERDGRVAPGVEYEGLRDRLIAEAEALRDPDTAERLVLRAYRREELYHGPLLANAADVILAPADGYDPKGALWKERLTHKDPSMVGMHTYDDAMLYIGGQALAEGAPRILDVMPTILALMGLSAPTDLDGRSLLV